MITVTALWLAAMGAAAAVPAPAALPREARLVPQQNEIRAMVLDGLTGLDKAFASCFRRAKEKGELPESSDPLVLAQIASATIHSIAIRSRARVPRKELEAIVKGAIDVMLAFKG